MKKYFGVDNGSNFSYWTYTGKTVYSSANKQVPVKTVSRSYEDEYSWFVKMCEEYGIEPECYED